METEAEELGPLDALTAHFKGALRLTPQQAGRCLERLRYQRDALVGVVGDLREDTNCRHDHHGYCQAHGWLQDGQCPEKRARDALEIVRSA